MSSVEQSNPSVIQKHDGIGNNAARDIINNVFQSIAPEALQEPIELIFSNIREKKFDIAKNQLQIIKATNSFDSDGKAILEMVSIHLGLFEDESKKNAYKSLISFLNKTKDNLSRDLCLATLIRLDVKSNRADDARERYSKFNSPDSYSQEVFYELIATADELENTYEEQRINLDEGLLNGFIRGAFRVESFEFSLKVAEQLNKISQSLNSKVLLLLATASNINIKLNGKHFWTITATLKAEIIKMIDEVIVLINESKGTESRLFNIAAPCLEYVNGEHKELRDICWKYVEEIEKNNPDVAARIYHIHTQDISKIKNDFDYKCRKADSDEVYRKQLLNELFAKKEISSQEFMIFNYFPDSKRISQWKNSGGIVIGVDNISTDLCNLQLNILTLANDKHPAKESKIEEIRIQAEILVEKHKEYLAKLHPVSLLELTERLLLCPTLSVIACDLIKPMLPISDIWVSPIVQCYLNCLLNSQQMMTVATVLSYINPNEWNSFVWQIQARQFEQQNDYPNAIQSIEEALKLDSSLLYAWNFLAYLHRKTESSDEDLALVLKRVPNKILDEKSEMAFNLLIEIAKTGDFFRAEKIILDWFIESPTASAITITNFYFNFIINNEAKLILTPEKVGDCIIGVTFKKDNKNLTKLLVDNIAINHDCLLDVNSVLGVMLNRMEIGELKQHGMCDIQLIERLPPYIAALRISSKLRQDQNNGSDGFYSFTVPDNPDEMVAVFERKLSMFNGDKQKKNETLNDPNIPLMFKGGWLYLHDPIKSALEIILTKNAKRQLPCLGEENPSEIILDIYAIIYLALTGLVYGIEQSSIKTVITQETKEAIEQWLEEINRENYVASMSIMENGSLCLQSAENRRQETQNIQKAFLLIIDQSEIIKPVLVDMPPIMLHVQKIVDISVCSSMKLSISNNIPWLCIDEMLSGAFTAFGWKQVNAIKLFTELGNSLEFEIKKDGLYLYAQGVIPYALTYRDIKLLSISNDKYAHYFLAKILFLHPKSFPDINISVHFLTEILSSALIKGFLTGQFMKGLRINNPSNNGYAERVFNACCYLIMQCDDGSTSERKLAMLLCKLIVIFGHIPEMIRLIEVLASEFAGGHFLSFPLINSCIKENFSINKL